MSFNIYPNSKFFYPTNSPMCGIYRIRNELNGKCYFGQSRNTFSRFGHYNSGHFKNQPKLYHTVQKYGIENFTFKVMKAFPLKMLNKKETEYIKRYDSFHNGYNCNYGGGVPWFISEETREKLSGDNSVFAIPIKINDDIYGSISTASKKLKISQDLIGYRLSITKYPNYNYVPPRPKIFKNPSGQKPSPIEIDGVIYTSIEEAASKISVTTGAINCRLRSSLFPTYNYIPKRTKQKRDPNYKHEKAKIIIDGTKYESISEACHCLKTDLATLHGKLNSSAYPSYQYDPPRPKLQRKLATASVIINNKKYKSKVSAAKHMNISDKQLETRLLSSNFPNYQYDPPRPKIKRKLLNHIIVNRKKYINFAEAAKDLNISLDNVRYRLKSSNFPNYQYDPPRTKVKRKKYTNK